MIQYLVTAITMEFQSTLSVRRATLNIDMMVINSLISIHALRKESDPQEVAEHVDELRISIHALRKESDL